MKKMLLAAAALAVVIASPALANAADGVWAASQAWNGRAQLNHTQAPGAYGPLGAYAQVPGAYGAYARSASPDAGLGGDYVGTDPDPNVQLELLKDAQQRD